MLRVGPFHEKLVEKGYDHTHMSFPPHIKCGVNCSGNPVIPRRIGLLPARE
jgi:hypothetical protein